MMTTQQPIKKTDNIYAITYDDNSGKVGDVEWGARRYDQTESSSDSGEDDNSPRDIKGYDPKKKQRKMARYAAVGVGIFLVCFFLIAGAMQVFSPSSKDEREVSHPNIDFGSDGDSNSGSASNEIDAPVEPKDTVNHPAEEPETEEPETETDGSTNKESTPDVDGVDEIEEGTPDEPESFVNTDPAAVPLGADWIMRVSAGSTKDYTDPSGHVWLADKDGESSKMFSVHGDDDRTWEKCPLEVQDSDYGGPGLYCNERFFKEGKEGGYEVPVPDAGIYEISLYFADIFFDKPGQREFDVLVEGRMLHRKFDIVKAAGAGNKATRIQTTQPITDGAVTIVFRAHTQNSKISAFEVRRVADLPDN